MVADEHDGASEGGDRSERDLAASLETNGQNWGLASQSSLQAPPSNNTSVLLPPRVLQSLAVIPTDAAHSTGEDTATNVEDVDDGSTIVGKNIGEGSEYQQKSSAISNLSLDTRAMSRQDIVREPQVSPLGTALPESQAQLHSSFSSLGSPSSSRNRDRGSSLRRAILARGIHSGSEMELQPTAMQQVHTGSGPGKKSEAKISVIPVAETTDDLATHPQFTQKAHELLALPHYETWIKSKAVHTGLRLRLQVAKERVRKKILGIQEIPPSKDGRHIDIDPCRREPLIDERTGRKYINNAITSSRYTLYNFLPRQLFAQFSKLANFYFLCVSILQMIPGLSTTGTYTTIVPLAFFVFISMAKEGYDDLRRYRLDTAENRKTALVLRGHEVNETDANSVIPSTATYDERSCWKETKWENIRIGDVVKVTRDEAAPADLVVLHTNGVQEMAYVETMALDGETNLKSKQALPQLAKSCGTGEDILSCGAHIVVQDPNLDLYNFEGRVSIGDETLPLANNGVIYRGSVLRNTSEAIGIVVYSGEECKIRMNATKNPRIKAVSTERLMIYSSLRRLLTCIAKPALQTVVNKVVVMLVVFVIVLAIFNTVAYQIWQETTEEKAWYLTNAGVAFFPILVSFIILFNTMIPLSLYVSLEIVKLFQMLLMNDVDMYDAASNTPMEARTSTINEELGQVKSVALKTLMVDSTDIFSSYIFSDKTGTLTNNSMRFRKMSICGAAWLHDPDVQEEAIKEATRKPALQKRHSKGKKPIRRRISISTSGEASAAHSMSTNSCGSPVVHNSSTRIRWKPSARTQTAQPELGTAELLQYIQDRPHNLFARKVRFFLLSIALCHTSFPEMKKNGEIEYQAASPDEQALVRAAQDLGYVMIDRQNSIITIKTLHQGHSDGPTFETYQILDVIEFSSSRKRMSVIVRMPDHRICLFCKGADSTLIQLLRLSGLAIAKVVEIEQRVSMRQSLEAQEALRRASEAKSRKDSMTRKSMSIHRPSLGAITRPSMTAGRLQPIRDEVDDWLKYRENDVDSGSIYCSPRHSAHYGPSQRLASLDGSPLVPSFQGDGPTQRLASLDGSLLVPSFPGDDVDKLAEEALVVDDAAVLERCFQHVNNFASEGLRTLLYGYRYMEEDEYETWRKSYLDASTSLVNRHKMIEKAGAQVERDLELAGATAIEDKLQKGVPEAIEKLRRASIKLWMLTGDKRETAVNIGHSCRLIKDYSSITILDHQTGEVSQRIAAATIDISNGRVAHSVVVVDGHTLSQINSSQSLQELFVSLAILADTVICCRASPSQKASLVSSIRHKVHNAITLAIGDGANDIAMIQEAHVGIGITGKEGLQAARTSDYSIAQFRFLTKLLLVHGRWNYIRTCKYTLGTFWKEMLFYLTQALYQRYAGYTGTSLYESWSLSMFNTLFTSLPVIFMGIFEQDLSASTLMAVPELYHSLGHRNGGFKIKIYLAWVAMAASQAVIVFFIMLGLFGQAIFTTDNGLYAMGALTFTACILIIATKMQFWELHNKTYTCAISMFLSVGGWFLWMIILSTTYHNNVIYDVKEGFLERFGSNPLWWLTLILVLAACWVLEIGVKAAQCSWLPSDADCFRELEKDSAIKRRFEQAAAMDSANTGIFDPAEAIGGLPSQRTAEEDRQREGEVQEMLDRPRHSSGASGAGHGVEIVGTPRKRQHSEPEVHPQEHKVSFAVEAKEDARDEGDDDDANGKEKPPRRSTDVQELLRRGFGSVRRSLDIV